MTEVTVVLCTCPDAATAQRLAEALVGQKLAACVNILPEIRSIYRWRGEIQQDAEVLLVVKTSRQGYPRIESWLLEHHPYDVPEVLALAVEAGSSDYMQWLLNEVDSI